MSRISESVRELSFDSLTAAANAVAACREATRPGEGLPCHYVINHMMRYWGWTCSSSQMSSGLTYSSRRLKGTPIWSKQS
jgi:hypothetical protein